MKWEKRIGAARRRGDVNDNNDSLDNEGELSGHYLTDMKGIWRMEG